MRVVVIANPRSGLGRALKLARSVQPALSEAGVQVREVLVGPEHPGADVEGAARGADALIVAGGDGTVTYAAPLASRLSVPLYHLPSGNENLFARQFGHGPGAPRLLAALRARRVQMIDAGEAHADVLGRARTFLLMASVGPDASVVRRLDAVRTRATGHLAYLGPTLAELREPEFPRVTVRVDGREVARRAIGQVIVGNCRAYALGVDPVAQASPHDGLLDAVHLPGETPGEYLHWAAMCRARAHLADGLGAPGGAWHARGQVVRIDSDRPEGMSVQIDGEALSARRAQWLELRVREASVPVLMGA